MSPFSVAHSLRSPRAVDPADNRLRGSLTHLVALWGRLNTFRPYSGSSSVNRSIRLLGPTVNSF